MIIVGMLALTIIAFLLINFVSGSESGAGRAREAGKMITEIQQLESNILELELIYDDLETNNKQNRTLLAEKRVEIQEYSRQIQELEDEIDRLEMEGQTDKDTIDRLRKELYDRKEALAETQKKYYEKEIEFLIVDNSKLTNLIDSLKGVQDEMLVANERLRKQAADCADGNTGLASNDGGRGDSRSVDEVVETIESKDVQWTFLNEKKRGKKAEVLKGSTFAKEIDNLLVKFNFTRGELESFFDRKKVHLVVYDADGKVFESKSGKRQSFPCDSPSGCISTATGLFNSGDGITFPLEIETGTDWKTGQYRFHMYSEGKKLSEGRLLIL
ncbi:MAG: hypothetical protein AAF206_15940 [Bacteroidota bacterium]